MTSSSPRLSTAVSPSTSSWKLQHHQRKVRTMNRKALTGALGGLLLFPGMACVTASDAGAKAGPPVPLTITEKDNPDVLWIVRTVDLGDGKVEHGLFACYRPPVTNPGPPRCYMAQHSWRREDLAWPFGSRPGQDQSVAPAANAEPLESNVQSPARSDKAKAPARTEDAQHPCSNDQDCSAGMACRKTVSYLFGSSPPESCRGRDGCVCLPK